MFWETREGRRIINILRMKRRRLELFNKASRQPCVLSSQEQGTVKPKIKKGEEANFWQFLNHFPYFKLAIAKLTSAHSLGAFFMTNI